MFKKIRIVIILISVLLCLAGCSVDEGSQNISYTTTTEAYIPDTQLQTTKPPADETTLPPTTSIPEPSDDDFVNIKTYIPDIFTDLRYSTEHNFTHQKIYNFTDAWLRYGTVKKLIQVQDALKELGYRLKIWDGFRPVSAQFRLW